MPDVKYVWDQKTDLEFMRTYLQFSNEQKVAGDNVSIRVHKMALAFNDPARPKVASMAFKRYVADLVDQLKTTEKTIDTTVFGFKKGDDDIKGNGAFANAFKRVFGAMWYGADLRIEATVTACQKYAREKAAEENKKREKDQLHEELSLSLAASPEWIGKDTSAGGKDEAEFRRAVNTELTKQYERSAKVRADDGDDQPDDVFAAMAKNIADLARQFGATDYQTAVDMLRALETRFEEKVSAMVKDSAASELSRTGS